MKHTNKSFRLKNAALAIFLCLVLSTTLGISIFQPSTVSAAKKAPVAAKTNSDEKKLTCDDSTSPLSWAICPAVDLMVKAVGVVDDVITNQLSIDTNQIFCSGKDTCKAYYAAWQSFRNIALGLMAIAGLIIVTSQALGLELLDAYAIRKALPRLLVAAVAITVSWPLMQFAITLSNDLGFGIRHLIYAPFSKLNDSISLSLTGGGAVGLLSFSALAFLELMGLLSLGATALLAVFIAVIVLILRQVAIILLLILSPIAIVAYILPNTQRAFKLWWESFSKALLMFPLIAAFIASGRVFSAIAIHNGGNFNQLIGFAAYFAPYFLLPATFKLAGGALSAMGGAVHNAGRPISGGLSKFRSGLGAKNWKKIRGGQRWNQDFGRFHNRLTGKDSSIGHLANRAAVNLFDQDELLPYRLGKERTIRGKNFGGVPGFKRGSANLQDQLDNRAIAESTKGLQAIDQNGGMHYQGWRALAGDFDGFGDNMTKERNEDGNYTGKMIKVSDALKKRFPQRPPASLGDFRAVSEILSDSTNDKDRLGADDIMKHAGTLASIKGDPEMSYADTQVMASMGLAAAGRAEPQNLADVANNIGGRLPTGVAQRALKSSQKLASRQERPDLRDGHGIIATKDAKGKIRYDSAYSGNPDSKYDGNYNTDTAIASVMSVKDSAWSSAKGEAVTAAAETLAHVARGGEANDASRLNGHSKKRVDNRSEDKILLDKIAMDTTISHGIQSYHGDPGQRVAWINVAKKAGAEAGWTDTRIVELTGEETDKPVSTETAEHRNRPEPPPAPDANGGGTPAA